MQPLLLQCQHFLYKMCEPSLFSYCHLSCVSFLFTAAMCRKDTPARKLTNIRAKLMSRMLNIYEFAAAGSCVAHRNPRCFGAHPGPCKAQQAHPWTPPELTLCLAQPLATGCCQQQSINSPRAPSPRLRERMHPISAAADHPSL